MCHSAKVPKVRLRLPEGIRSEAAARCLSLHGLMFSPQSSSRARSVLLRLQGIKVRLDQGRLQGLHGELGVHIQVGSKGFIITVHCHLGSILSVHANHILQIPMIGQTAWVVEQKEMAVELSISHV